MTKCYQAVVIGLGRVGSSYQSINTSRTHIGAYSQNQRISVAAGVDPNTEARKKFSKKWGNDIPVYSSVEEMLVYIKPDIVSVCVPPPILTDIVAEFLQHPPKLFFLEKPVVVDKADLRKLLKVINNVPTAVNYHRCWDPAHNRFFSNVLKSGDVISIRILYNKGMFNYASHMISLLIKYFGEVANVGKMPTKTHNSMKQDPSFSFFLEFFRGFYAVFQGFDNISYDLLELEIMTTKGMFSLKSGGCRRQVEKPKKNVFYPDYTQLVNIPYSESDTPVQGLDQAVENFINYLDGIDNELSCDLSLSLQVIDVMCEVKRRNYD